MKKKNILSKNRDFQRIIENKKQYITNAIVLYYEKKQENNIQIGISISKKLGNAVFRNKHKREIKRILDAYFKKTKTINLNYNLVLIIRKKFIEFTLQEKTKEIENILNKLNKRRKCG